MNMKKHTTSGPGKFQSPELQFLLKVKEDLC